MDELCLGLPALSWLRGGARALGKGAAPAGTAMLWVLALAGGAYAAVVARIDTQRAISHTDPAYLSFNIDAAELRGAGSGGFPWASKTLAARAKHLAPMKLRIGGGAQSGDVYDKAFVTQKLPLITAMTQAMGAKLVWGTAPCKQHGDKCDMANAEALVKSAAAAGIAVWVFGNVRNSLTPPPPPTTTRPPTPPPPPDLSAPASADPCCACRSRVRRVGRPPPEPWARPSSASRKSWRPASPTPR